LAFLVAEDADSALAHEGRKMAQQGIVETPMHRLISMARELCPGPAGRWLIPAILGGGQDDDDILELAALQFHHHPDPVDPSGISAHFLDRPERSLDPLIRHFSGSKQPLLALNVISRILDRTDPKAPGLGRVWDFAIETLREGPREALPILLEFPLGRMAPSESQRRQWLRELLLARSRLSSEHLLGEIDRRFADAGVAGLEVLCEAANTLSEPRDRLHALDLGAQLAGRTPEAPARLSDLVTLSQQDSTMEVGELLLVRGKLWAHEHYPATRRSQEVQEALSSLWRRSRTLERLQALTLAARRLDPPQAAALLLAVQDLFTSRLPKIERHSIRRPEFLDGTALEEDFLVTGLEAAAALFQRQDLPEGMIRSLAEQLLDKWSRVGSGQTLWGPAGTRALVRALASLATLSDWEHRVIAALAADPGFMEVQRALVRLWPRVQDAEAVRVATFLHQRLAEVRTLEPEELETLLALVRAWVETATGAREPEAARLINRVLGVRRNAKTQVEAFLAHVKPPSDALSAMTLGAR
ncbi:MAG: hypothetical protein AB7F75_11815, partial [Planctomycetota bacterium]